eukprot:3829610-Pleurochrysis_carterae.AAC.1
MPLAAPRSQLSLLLPARLHQRLSHSARTRSASGDRTRSARVCAVAQPTGQLARAVAVHLSIFELLRPTPLLAFLHLPSLV